MAEAKIRENSAISSVEKEYDETPYTSYPFEHNQPERLHAIGTLFDMDLVPIEQARILEIGGADGANLLRFALDYPDSKVIGIDLSETQVNKGKERINKLGIKNYELKHMSVTDLDEGAGTFDYIICHGVFSWVPKDVQQAILAKCKKHLSPKGLAFTSYNTLPGWNMVKTVRELMRYHSDSFTDVRDKVSQARLALNFVVDTLKDNTDPYSQFLKNTANSIQSKEDHYIRHEYLADNNDPMYFQEFIKQAAEHRLAYVADSDVHRMFTGNLPQSASEKLAAVNDIVRTEQYMDFIRNSQFRCTILCHDDVKLSRNISNSTLSKLYLCGGFNPERPFTDEEVYSTEPLRAKVVKGYVETELSLDLQTPAMKGIFATLNANKANPLKQSELANEVVKKYPKLDKKEVQSLLEQYLSLLIFKNFIQFHSYKPKSTFNISDKPKLSQLNQSSTNFMVNGNRKLGWLTTQTNGVVTFDMHDMLLVEHFNGKNTIKDLEAKALECLKEKKIVAQQQNGAAVDEKLYPEIAKEYIARQVGIYRDNFLLVE